MWLRTIGLISTLVLGLLAGPLSVEAQQPGKVYRIGYLSSQYYQEAFRQGLRELGYIEGKNIVIEWRFAKGKRKRFHKLAAELVKLKVDIIFTGGTVGTRAAKKATRTIPIVMGNVGDPVGRGLIASLARPGGNITGLTSSNSDLAGKRLELLKEAFPKVTRVAVLWDSSRRGNDSHYKGTEAAAGAMGVQLQSVEVRPPYDFENAFRAAVKGRAEALIVTGAGMRKHRARIVELAANKSLPGMYSNLQHVTSGGLMSYAVNRVDLYRRAATYVDKILKGRKPADLPVERPTKFEFAINLKTAKALGLTIPPEVLYRATKVIK